MLRLYSSSLFRPSLFIEKLPHLYPNAIFDAKALSTTKNASSGPKKNEMITSKEIFYIDEEGTKQGIKPLKDVLGQLDRKRYDLIEVNSEHSPPICKLVSREQAYKRLQSMEDAAVRERYKLREKELRFGTSMADHDYAIRIKRASEILEKAFRVKVVVEPKGVLGREALSKERLWKKIFDDLLLKYGKDLSLVSAPQVEFRNLTATLALLGAKPSAFASKKENDK